MLAGRSSPSPTLNRGPIMKVGPLDLPVNNVMQLVAFVLLVIASIYVARRLPIPAQFKP
jgi:hypothetical protein